MRIKGIWLLLASCLGSPTAANANEISDVAVVVNEFANICAAHPRDQDAQREAISESSRRYQLVPRIPDRETFNAWPIQLQLRKDGEVNLCYVMSGVAAEADFETAQRLLAQSVELPVSHEAIPDGLTWNVSTAEGEAQFFLRLSNKDGLKVLQISIAARATK
ncbi:hypothetical protein ACFQRC_08420 [Enterovirga sp. GCM10030262]|uniref:hypothetical protein n=1 Tax=Enterovirga sp. GCM10030262 TaxID=3273391 RepID=UPI00360843D3